MRKQVDNVNQISADAADEVFERIHTIMHLYRSQQYRALRDGIHDLTHMENKVLGFFARHPGATQSDLVMHSGRDKAQLARLIRGLKDRGFLEAGADAADRRSVRLQVTSAGQAVFRHLQQQGRHLSHIAVKGLSEEEKQVLVSMLDRVRSNLESEEK
ncbi:MarR family winged helix-turn-helix transcriptional regulator [Noviherbaspirillum saxi]|uniref:MarR family transcriptional regulator n=1 Tax=Noviherbaspirillum saxi TaxID=2320863 RepID=A0A3A3G000_9BURK|nr:MarR family transcriptional regulator [Noviherbaspirillum saxi]RJF92649.1 MarR family transcriptional regulator [Noviherbaspirillum saxi]